MNHAHQVQKNGNQTVRAFAREAMTSAMLHILARQEMSGMVQCLIKHPSDIRTSIQLHSNQRVSKNSVQGKQSSLISRTRKGSIRMLSRRRGEDADAVVTLPLDRVEDTASRSAVLLPIQFTLFSGIKNHNQEHKALSTFDKLMDKVSDIANDMSKTTVMPTAIHPELLVQDVETKALQDMGAKNEKREDITPLSYFGDISGDSSVKDPIQETSTSDGAKETKEHDVMAESVPHETEEDDIRKVMAALGRIGQEDGEAMTHMNGTGIHARLRGRLRVVSNPERVSVPTRFRGTREVMVEHVSIAKTPEVRVIHSRPDPLASITDELLAASKRIEVGPQEALRAKSMVEKIRRRLSEMDFRIQSVLGRPRDILG